MNRPRIKKVVVTGGAGFIGSHVTKMLCDEGFKVTVLDDLSFGFKKFVDPRAEFVQGSTGNKPLLDNILKNKDAIIHLAASSTIKFSFLNPVECFKNNLMNGVLLLEAMRKNKIRHIVYSSTAAVYGEPKRIPIREDDPKNPINIYGASKLAFEETLKSYYHAFKINSISLRFFNVYGPHDEQIPPTRAIPIWIKAALNNKPLGVYWNGGQKRDYIFVKDVAEAHLKVLGLEGCRFYNIGTGSGIWMKDIIRHLEKISGKKLKTKDLSKRPGDPKFLVADIQKIKREIGWKPQTNLKRGLKITFDYYKNSA